MNVLPGYFGLAFTSISYSKKGKTKKQEKKRQKISILPRINFLKIAN